jgi:CheY-like chemotaxis protein
MTQRVLVVGNCDADYLRIRSLVEGAFDAVAVRCDGPRDTIEELQAAPADLVLVNRILDGDQSRGLNVIIAIKADAQLARTPCMLLSNFAAHQQAAVAAGAEPGFGKAELDEPATRQRLAKFLA